MFVTDIPIAPVPMGRPRFNSDTHRAYLQEKDEKFRQEFGYLLARRVAAAKLPIYTGPIAVSIVLHNDASISFTSKRYGDIDNHTKAILDACKGIVFEDDSQVVILNVFKSSCSGEKPHIGLQVLDMEEASVVIDQALKFIPSIS